MNFRSILFFVVLNIFFVNISHASNKNNFGLKAGLSISNYSNDKIDYQGSPTIGINYNHQLDHNLFLQSEIIYKSNIYIYNTTQRYSNREIKYFSNLTLNYLEIPFLLKYKYYSSTDVYIGPSIHFLINGEYDFRYENVSNNNLDDHSFYKLGFKNNGNKPGYSVIVGTSITLNSVIFDLRYFHDLSNIINKDQKYPNLLKGKFNGFQFTLGANFN